MKNGSQDPRALVLGAKAHEGPFHYHWISAPEVTTEFAEMIRQGVAYSAAAFRCENCWQHFAHIALVNGMILETVIPQQQIEACRCDSISPIIIDGDKGKIA